MISKNLLHTLFYAALDASKNSYSPYSHFPVGAALLMEDDSIITGCNVENRSYGLSNCAERTAVFCAIARGYTKLRAIAIATPAANYPVGPCGACRQVLSEFAEGDTPVVFGSNDKNLVYTTIAELYPLDSLHDLADISHQNDNLDKKL